MRPIDNREDGLLGQSCADGALPVLTSDAEPSAAWTPGRHLHALSVAFFNGGGWADPFQWGDFDAEGHAHWEALAEGIGRNLRKAAAAPDMAEALKNLLNGCEEADELGELYDSVTGEAMDAAHAALSKAGLSQ